MRGRKAAYHPAFAPVLSTTAQCRAVSTCNPYENIPLSSSDHHQIMINVIKESFDIKIQNPIKLPAMTTCRIECIQCRFPRTIPVGILIEHRFQFRLQIQFNRHLCNSVSHGRNAKSPSPARLGYQDCSDRRWKIAFRGHLSINKPDSVVLNNLKIRRMFVYRS